MKGLRDQTFCFLIFNHSCINTYAHSCLKPVSNKQKTMFKSWYSCAVWTWVLTKQHLKWAPSYLHDIIQKALQHRLIISPMLERNGSVVECLIRDQKGSGFVPHRCHWIVSLSKNINPSLVLVQPRKTRPYITERLLMGGKESNQINFPNGFVCENNALSYDIKTLCVWLFTADRYYSHVLAHAND